MDWRQLRQADLQLRREYRERGFLHVKVNPRSTVIPSTQVLSYRVSVIEGRQYRVGSVSIPKGLLTQFPLQSGDVFAPGLLAEFVRESGISEAGVLVARNPEQALVQITISQWGPCQKEMRREQAVTDQLAKLTIILVRATIYGRGLDSPSQGIGDRRFALVWQEGRPTVVERS